MLDWLLVLVGGPVGAPLRHPLGVGAELRLHSVSTWSTFSHELLTLAPARRLGIAAGCLLLSVGAGVGLSFAGAAVADAVR
ncbi:hypothetical protein ACFVYE_19275 [Streptomyces sp. NPDC058239]|uniref:hypothetical protein n=1 Tax=unclassified Streptomyces TaxID=2593676 RepID=UPI0036540318